MKRFIALVLGGLLVNTLVFAQMGGSTQRGRATQEQTSSGLVAAHSSIPLDSKVKIINIATEAEIEVTITGRILASPRRVIDLSAEAWEALDMSPDTIVSVVYTPPPPPSARVVKPVIVADPEIEPDFEEETVFTMPPAPVLPLESAAPPLYHLLVLDRMNCPPDSDIGDLRGGDMLYKFKHGRDGYLVALYTSAGDGPVFPAMPEHSRILADMVTVRVDTLREYVQSNAFKKFVTHKKVLTEIKEVLSGSFAALPPAAAAPVSAFAPAPPRVAAAPAAPSSGRIKVIPGMPKANSGKIYCLQVGAFNEPELADETVQQVIAAGFEVVIEQHGDWYRVLAVGIRSGDAAFAIQKLEDAGFKEVWVRE